eukprot:UN03967
MKQNVTFCEDYGVKPDQFTKTPVNTQMVSPMMSDRYARNVKLHLPYNEKDVELKEAIEQAAQSRNSIRIGCQPLLIRDAECNLLPIFKRRRFILDVVYVYLLDLTLQVVL